MALTDLVPTIEIRSSVWFPVRISTSGVQGGGPSPIVRALKPTVIAIDANGNQLTTIAPYGQATDAERFRNMLVLGAGVVLVLGGTFALGFLAARA